MNTTLKWIIGIVIIAILGWFAFSDDTQTDQATTEVIKIGVLAPLTGPAADYGEEIKRGVSDADIDTEHIEFIFEDTECDNPSTLNAFRKLTDIDKVRFIIGPGCGSPQEVITPLLAEKDVVVLVPSAASRSLYEQSEGHFYNMQYALEDESAFIADTMYDMGYENVAFIGFKNAFSQTHGDSFMAHYKGNIVSEIWYQNEVTDVASELLKVRESNPDAIFSTDISFFFADGLGELRRLGVDAPVFTSYIAELPAARPLVEGVIYSYPADVIEGEGAVYGLSRQSAEFLAPLALTCDGDPDCVRERMDKARSFDDTGVFKRDFIVKEIKDGQPVKFSN